MADAADEPRPERDIARELRLRADPPRVTRVSRKVLLVAGGTAALAIGGASIYALQGSSKLKPPAELYSLDHRATADKLASLPKDYTGLPHDVPKLGPPLPGDLGRPILSAQQAGQGVPVPPQGLRAPSYAPPPSPAQQARAQERQRRVQEVQAARAAKLFTGSAREGEVADVPTASPAAAGESAAPAVLGQPATQTAAQDRKLAFVNAASDRRTEAAGLLQAPTSPNVVQAGTVIAGALLTGLRSDLPGQVTAQVTENVYDSPTGRVLLIPQGSRLIGTYDAQISTGQRRALLVWTRLLLPDGRSLTLERQPGTDAQGYAGLQDRVDNHWGALFRGALVSTLLSVGANAGATGQNGDLGTALRRGTSDAINQVGNQVVGRQLDIQPTLTIRPGFPVRVLVTRDLTFAPYGG